MGSLEDDWHRIYGIYGWFSECPDLGELFNSVRNSLLGNTKIFTIFHHTMQGHGPWHKDIWDLETSSGLTWLWGLQFPQDTWDTWDTFGPQHGSRQRNHHIGWEISHFDGAKPSFWSPGGTIHCLRIFQHRVHDHSPMWNGGMNFSMKWGWGYPNA